MKYSKILSCVAAAVAAASLFADAGNTLIAFSTKGDVYADGTTVKDGEWYALCWSKNAEFGGITSECEPVVAGDEIFVMAPLAKGGRCPTVVFQIDSKVAPEDGNYFVYLLDTRGVNGEPAAKAVVAGKQKPALVNAAVATTAKTTGSSATADIKSQTDKELAKDGSVVAWGESAIDESKVGQPVIKAFRIDGDNVVISVSNMHPSVRYNVFAGASPDEVTATSLEVPLSAGDNDVEFNINKDQGKFFKVARQPVK